MKKLFSFFLLMMAMGSIFTGCKGGSMSNATPKEVLVAFIDKISKEDFEGARELVTAESQITLGMMKMEAEKMKREHPDLDKKDFTEQFKNVELGEAKIDGDMATVPIKSKLKNDQQFDLPLKKENGAWKVDILTTVMGMMQKYKDKMGMGVDEMKGMDHLADSLREGIKIMDTSFKKMDPKKLEEAMKQLEKLKKSQ